MSVALRYQNVRAQVDAVARAAARDPKDVLVIGVSKTVGVPEVQDAVQGGAHDFGENRLPLLQEKATALPQEHWHFIGNIQSRAIPGIVEHACLIHSVFQERHLLAIEKAAAARGKLQDILFEVSISGEESKGGCTPAQVSELLACAQSLSHVRVRGLMTMAPQGDAACARETFEGLAALHAELRAHMDAEQAAAFNELSMGMSEDWREAVAAGATIVRIGRAIFSETFE